MMYSAAEAPLSSLLWVRRNLGKPSIPAPAPRPRCWSRSSSGLLLLLALISHPRCALTAWIDMDTPLDKRTTKSLIDGTTYHLVMSDEFNVANRTFKDGHDPTWTALDKSDDDASSAGGGSMQFYNSSAVSTSDGYLKIRTFSQKTEWNHYDHVNKRWKKVVTNFTSGMVQSWNKFCFTGGIVEVDVIFPGNPYIGGLWPAVWMLGNLGRATYEASTNNIWPWSFDTCDRELQPAQTISACNYENHYGMNKHQGRGATEIDIVEVMYGNSNGALPATDPPVELPYGDFTLQVAPGVPKNRPQSGAAILRENVLSKTGHTQFMAQTWYDGLQRQGNTSLNPFFYGTYLAETKPNEPVTRSKKQAFQADAVGVVHQLVPSHFTKPHTFRLEWQPGRGGRLDWFVKGYKVPPGANTTQKFMTGDGNGKEWVHAFSIKDKSLKDLMGSQIPIEPSYLIMNTAVSSTWGFPYDTPDWCRKCYDCNNPECACSFYPGFCQQMDHGNVTMYVDNVRVYQSREDSAHVGSPHTLGCDPPDYPTKEWINGHEYRYMRNPPFSFNDKHPLRKVQRGGGSCKTDDDCGGDVRHENLTEVHGDEGAEPEVGRSLMNEAAARSKNESSLSASRPGGRGKCTSGMTGAMFSSLEGGGRVCTCQPGFTGPHCLAQLFRDDTVSAYELRMRESPFRRVYQLQIPYFLWVVIIVLGTLLVSYLVMSVVTEKRSKRIAGSIETTAAGTKLRKPAFTATPAAQGNDPQNNVTIITGTSI